MATPSMTRYEELREAIIRLRVLVSNDKNTDDAWCFARLYVESAGMPAAAEHTAAELWYRKPDLENDDTRLLRWQLTRFRELGRFDLENDPPRGR